MDLCSCCYYFHFEIFLVSESVFHFYLHMFETRSLKPLEQVLNSSRLIDSRVNSFSLIINWTAYISHWSNHRCILHYNKSAPLCTYYVIIIKCNTLNVSIKNVYSRLPLCYVSYYHKYNTLHVSIKSVYSRLPLCYVSYYIKYKTCTFYN